MSELNGLAARITAQKTAKKNKTASGAYTAQFRRSKWHQWLDSDWYNYYIREFDDVTKIATIAVQSGIIVLFLL